MAKPVLTCLSPCLMSKIEKEVVTTHNSLKSCQLKPIQVVSLRPHNPFCHHCARRPFSKQHQMHHVFCHGLDFSHSPKHVLFKYLDGRLELSTVRCSVVSSEHSDN